MDIVETVRRSRTYRGVRTVRGWADGSVVVAHLRRHGSERLAGAAVLAVLAASVVAVLGSNLGAAVKFLSFVAAFAVVAAVLVSVTDPPTENG